MLKRKIIPILVLSFILIISLGAVSASDIDNFNTVDNPNGDLSKNIASFNINSDLNSVDVNSSEYYNLNDGISVGNSIGNSIGNSVNENTVNNGIDGSFSDLQNEINDASSTLELNRNYSFQTGDDVNGVSGVKIQKNLTINGNGNTLNANGLSAIFNISSGNVVINDLIFTHSSPDLNAILAFNTNLILNNVSFIDNYGTYDVELNEDSNLTVYNSISDSETASILNNGGNITNLEIIILHNMTLGAVYDEYVELFALVSTGGLKVHGENFKFIINGNDELSQDLEAIDEENNGYYNAFYLFKGDVNVNIKYLGNSNPTIYSGNLKNASLVIPKNYTCNINDTINIEVILDSIIEGKIELYLLNRVYDSIDYVFTNLTDVPDVDGKYHYVIPVNTSEYEYFDSSSIIASLVSNEGDRILLSNPDKLISFNKVIPVIDEFTIDAIYGGVNDISINITGGSVGDEVILHIYNNTLISKVKNLTYLDGNQLKVSFSGINITKTGIYDTYMFYLRNGVHLSNTTVHWNVSKVDTKIIINPSPLNGTVNVGYNVNISVLDESTNHNPAYGKINVSYFDKDGLFIENKTFDLVDGQIYLNLKYAESGIYSLKFNYIGGNKSYNTDNYNPSNASLIVNIKNSNVLITINSPKTVNCEINDTIVIEGSIIDENGNIPQGNVTVNLNGVDFVAIVNETGNFTLKLNSSVSGEWNNTLIHFISGNNSVWNDSDSDESNLVNITVSKLTPSISLTSTYIKGYVNDSLLIQGTVKDKYGNLLSGNVTMNLNGVEFNASVDNGAFKFYLNSSIAGFWSKIEVKFTSIDSNIWNNASINTLSIYVRMLNTNIVLNSSKVTIKVDETGYIEGNVNDTVHNLPASGMVYVTLNGNTFNSTVDSNGNFKIPINCNVSGTYRTKVMFVSGNNSVWNNKTVTVTVSVNGLATNIVPEYGEGNTAFNIYCGEESFLNFTVYDEHNNTVKNGSLTLHYNGGNYVASVGSDGKVSIPITLSQIGSYGYIIEYTGDKYYDDSIASCKIKVNGIPTEMVISDNISGVLGDPSNNIIITVLNSNTKEPVTTGYVYFNLPDGTQVSKDLVNGQLVFNVTELNTIGVYEIYVSYVDTTNNYCYCSSSFMWNVTKPVTE